MALLQREKRLSYRILKRRFALDDNDLEDLKEDLIHSLQKYVEVDEPEPETMPLIGAPGTGVDADDTEVVADRMTEEELLKGLEGLAPPEEQPEPDDAE